MSNLDRQAALRMHGTWSMIQGHHDRRNPEF